MSGRSAPLSAVAAVVFAMATVALASTRGAHRPPEPPPAAARPGPSRPRARVVFPLDLNQATREQLEELPGIGPATAARIVEARARAGGFRGLEDLDAVKGIGTRTLERLRPLVRVGTDVRRSVPVEHPTEP